MYIKIKSKIKFTDVLKNCRGGLKAMNIQSSTKLDGLFIPVRAMKNLSRLVTNFASRHLQKHSRRETPDTCPDRL